MPVTREVTVAHYHPDMPAVRIAVGIGASVPRNLARVLAAAVLGEGVCFAFMERAARRLLAFSFVSLLAVLVFGMVRGLAPVRAWLAAPDVARTAALFHSHFDQLCWLGSAAAGTALWVLRDSYRGAAWAPRLKTGMDALYASALKGKAAMPPKGGNTALADADVKAAVDYMTAAAK